MLLAYNPFVQLLPCRWPWLLVFATPPASLWLACLLFAAIRSKADGKSSAETPLGQKLVIVSS